MKKKGSNWWVWFWIILFLIIMISAIRHSYYRSVMYDDLYVNQYNEQLQQQDRYEQQMQEKLRLQQQEESQQYTSLLCQTGYVNEYQCSEDNIQQKYQYSDCTITWVHSHYCSYGCLNGACNQEPQYSYYMSLCKGSANCFVGKVTHISDGDTLYVDGIGIRLALTNTPEYYEKGFQDAKEFTEALCPVGSSVLVDKDDGQTAGSHGRIIAVVYCGDYNLNEQLLESGHGELWNSFCNASEFSNENWAVKSGC